MNYINYMKNKFGIVSQDSNGEFLEIIKNFLVLYSIYEESFQLGKYSLTPKKIKDKIEVANKNIVGINELYEHFHNRYTNNPEKMINLFRDCEIDFENRVKDCLQKDKVLGVSNLEKQVFLGLIANRYRNNTLHGSKESVRWHEYKEEFNILNEYLYLWLVN